MVVGLAIVAAGPGCSGGSPTATTAPSGSTNRPPAISSVAASPEIGLQAATPFAFAVQATDADGDVLSYEWNFGDGSTGSTATALHVYQATGAFAVRVSISDGTRSTSGQTTVTVRDLTGTWVKPAPPCSPPFAAPDPSTPVGEVFRINQSGAMLSGAFLNNVCSGAGVTAGQISAAATGFVSTTAPHVTLRFEGQAAVPADTVHYRFTGGVNGDVTILPELEKCLVHSRHGTFCDYGLQTFTRQP
jgi:hypothetical protein